MNHSFEKSEQGGRQQRRCPHEHNFFLDRPQKPVFGGVIIILVGVALLLKRMPGIGEVIPDWLFTWPMILILIGIFAAVKNRNLLSGAIPFLIGVFFLLSNEEVIGSFRPFLLPILIILFGFFFLLRRQRINRRRDYHREAWRRWAHQKANQWRHMHNHEYVHDETEGAFSSQTGEPASRHQSTESSADYLDINAVFGGVKKNYFSKNFKGGNITCVFGGGKINFVQADMQDVAVLNITAVCGGVDITIPSNWKVKNELNALFGGIEDKRNLYEGEPQEPPKVLILRGSVFCGGVQLRS